MAKHKSAFTDIPELNENPAVEKAVLNENKPEVESYLTVFEYCAKKGISQNIAAGISVLPGLKKDNTEAEWIKIVAKYMSWDTKSAFTF